MMKRIATYLLLLGVVLTMTLQTVPHASGMPSEPTISMAGMDMGGCDRPATTPCEGMTPSCIDTMSCVTIISLPTIPFAAATPFEWGILSYAAVDVALAGRTIRPELFPPILSA